MISRTFRVGTVFAFRGRRMEKYSGRRDKDMTCTHFRPGSGICGRGMPVAELYMKLICGRSPEKCPLVAAGVGFSTAGLKLFEEF